MQGLQNGGGRQKPGSRTEALRFAVSLCALAGVINIAVRLIVLFLFSLFFKIPKKEVHLLTWLLSKLGDALLGGVKKDIKDLVNNTDARNIIDDYYHQVNMRYSWH